MTDFAEVQRLLHFTSTDLPYNRRGELSPEQLELWKKSERGCRRNLLLLLLAMLGIAALAFFVFQEEGLRLSVGIGSLVMAALFAAGFVLMSTPTPDFDKLYTISGESRLDIGASTQGAKHYMLVIGKTDFTITKALYDVLEHGAPYTAHYRKVGRSNQLVSLEPAEQT